MELKQARNNKIYEYWVAHGGKEGMISYSKLGSVFHISKARAYQLIKRYEEQQKSNAK